MSQNTNNSKRSAIQRIRSPKQFKKCILCEKMNNHIFFDVCFVCWVKIEDKMGFSPKNVKQKGDSVS